MITLQARRRAPTFIEITRYLINHGYRFQIKTLNSSGEWAEAVYLKLGNSAIYVPYIDDNNELRDIHISVCLNKIAQEVKIETYDVWQAITGECDCED